MSQGVTNARLQMPPNVRVVRVMCTGRIDPTVILEAFARGADGVLVCGCHPGDCHYISGNLKALGRLELVKKTLVELGIEPQRLRLEWISAQEAERYKQTVTEMTEALRPLGPLSWPQMLTASAP